MKLLENVADRYIKSSNKGVITYTDELNILNHLLNKFNPVSKSEYAKKENISIPGVNDRIKRGKLMCIEMIGKTFIFN